MDKKEEKEFDSIINIDKNRLDDECENQPYLMWMYGKELSKAIFVADEAKAEIKIVEAELDLSVRKKPGRFGLSPDKKPSEEAIKKAIVRSERWKTAVHDYNEAVSVVNTLDAAVKSIDHRRTSLTMLDKQEERGYYSRPQQKQRTDQGDDFGERRKRIKKKKKR
jgi:hypothetical protein